MTKDDIARVETLMRHRDHHLLHTEEFNRSNLLGLADEVPGLLEEVRRLGKESGERLRAVHNTLTAYCHEACRHPEHPSIDIEHTGFCREMSAFIMGEGPAAEDGVWKALEAAELQVESFRKALLEIRAELERSHDGGCILPLRDMVNDALGEGVSSKRVEEVGAAYGEVCPGCGLLARITCRCRAS